MEKTLTFDELPSAIYRLSNKLEAVFNLLSNPHSEIQDKWFNLTELADYLPSKPQPQTIYKWVHERTIPYHKTGKSLSFLKSEIDEWLRLGRRQTTAEVNKKSGSYLKKKGVDNV